MANPIINDFLNTFVDKADFDGALFEMATFKQVIDYGVMAQGVQREKVIEEKIKDIHNPLLKKFLQNLIEAGKQSFFEPGNFKTAIDAIKDSSKNIAVIGLITAIKLDQDELVRLSRKIASSSSKKILFDIKVEPSIIGGVIIKKDNYILDYSIKTKLASLASDWKKSIRTAKEEKE